MKTFKQIIQENFKRPGQNGEHGPLMGASDWIKKSSLEKLANHPEINSKDNKRSTTIYSGHTEDPWDNNTKKKHVAILSHNEPDEKNFKHGYNKPHDWYRDTGMGLKHGTGSLTITGHAHIHPDGKVTYHGAADPKQSHNLMVYK